MSALHAYRDDGPAAASIAGLMSARPRVGEAAGTFAGCLVAATLALIGVLGDEHAVRWIAAAAVAFVALAAPGAGASSRGKLDWLVPPLLRLGEYSLLLVMAWAHDAGSVPLVYALLGALAFHHYDIVYRLRHQQREPARWVRLLGGGWEGRLLVAAALMLAGWLDEVLPAAAVVLAIAYVGESLLAWVRFSQAARSPLYESGEDEED